MKIRNIFILMLLSLASLPLAASVSADSFIRGNAKFNVVVIVLIIIFTGISIFMFMLDRRMKKLEKHLNDK